MARSIRIYTVIVTALLDLSCTAEGGHCGLAEIFIFVMS